MHDNSGDANISKMTLIAIVFVVGAILLLLITSAFNGPITTWFNEVITSWFDSANGDYVLQDPLLFYEKNANGTYQGLRYIRQNADGTYEVLQATESMENGKIESYSVSHYFADGTLKEDKTYIYPYHAKASLQISEDGQAITINGHPYVVEVP